MAFSGNSSEFPYRGGILALQGGFLFTGRYLFFYMHTLLMSRWKIYLWTSNLRLGESSLELLRQARIPKTTGNSRESIEIPGNLGNSQGHFTKPGIPLHYCTVLYCTVLFCSVYCSVVQKFLFCTNFWTATVQSVNIFRTALLYVLKNVTVTNERVGGTIKVWRY